MSDRLGKYSLTAQWAVKRQTLMFCEIPTAELADRIPDVLDLVEVRPGIALFGIEALHYAAGHFRPDHPECVEIVTMAMVGPDLSIDMPMPKFSMFVLGVHTNSPDFVEHEKRLLNSPMQLLPDLRIEFDELGTSSHVLDGETLIAACESHITEPTYERKTLWGLTYANGSGRLTKGAFRWEGDVFEQSPTGGSWGSFEPHPVFNGIDVTKIRTCYRQMGARPTVPIAIRYFHFGSVG